LFAHEAGQVGVEVGRLCARVCMDRWLLGQCFDEEMVFVVRDEAIDVFFGEKLFDIGEIVQIDPDQFVCIESVTLLGKV
jgi:hypothetical protein